MILLKLKLLYFINLNVHRIKFKFYEILNLQHFKNIVKLYSK